MFSFHLIHKKCRKLLKNWLSHILKSGLKNNWMKKLDRVNRPLHICSDLTRIKWSYLCYEGHFPLGGIFRAERHFLLFKDQLAESGRQKTKENIIPPGKFCLVENGPKSIMTIFPSGKCVSVTSEVFQPPKEKPIKSSLLILTNAKDNQVVDLIYDHASSIFCCFTLR